MFDGASWILIIIISDKALNTNCFNTEGFY